MVWVIRAIWCAGGVMLILGLVVFIRALVGDRARGRKRCPKCWYDMGGVSGVAGLRCPECGKVARAERSLFKTRRRPGRAVLGAALVVLSMVVWRAPAAIETGWWSAVPTVGLVTILQFYDTPNGDVFDRLQERLGTESEHDMPRWEQRMLAKACARALRTQPPPVGVPSAGAPMGIRALPVVNAGHRAAMDTLIRLGPRARPALPELIAALDDYSLRDSAIQAITNIGPGAADAVEPISTFIRSSIRMNRAPMFHALVAIGVPSPAAEDAAISILRGDEGLSSKSEAAEFLAALIPRDRTLQVLMDVLADGDCDTRVAAARGIKLAGGPTPKLVPAVVAATRDRICPLGPIGMELLTLCKADGVAALASLTLDEDPTIAAQAAAALCTMGPRAVDATPALIRALSNPDPYVPVHAANALRMIGRGAAEAIPALEALASRLPAPGAREAGWALDRIR